MNTEILTNQVTAAGRHALAGSPARFQSSVLLFCLIVCALIVHTVLFQSRILTRDTFYRIYQDQLESTRVDRLYDIAKGYKTLTYPLVPLLFLIQQTLLALFLQLPLVFTFREIRFSSLFKILLKAYIPLLFLAFLQLFVLWTLPSHELTASSLKTIPLSLNSLVSPERVPEHIFGFLGNFNLFQAAWIVTVSRGLSRTRQISAFDAALLATGVWIFLILIQFLIVNYLHQSFGV